MAYTASRQPGLVPGHKAAVEKLIILPSVAIVADLLEERWPSMDLVAEMIAVQLRERHEEFTPEIVRPSMLRGLSADDDFSGWKYNFDRLANRLWHYPRYLHRKRNSFDLFHLVDHSYAQLVHDLPGDRTIVTCHDLDTFRSLVDPASEERPLWFRLMTKRILSGLRKARFVTCDSDATRAALASHGLVSPDKLVTIPLGVHPSCSPMADPEADDAAGRLLRSESRASIDLLHVGSTIPRKRIDLLLRVFASVADSFPEARLIRVGGGFTRDQESQIDALGIRESIVVLPFLDRRILAAVYRRVNLVLLTSESEGFGFPVLEAMACGTPVVTTDIPVLREVGAESALYFPTGQIEGWGTMIKELLSGFQRSPESRQAVVERGLSQAAKFSWTATVNKFAALYHRVLDQRERA